MKRTILRNTKCYQLIIKYIGIVVLLILLVLSKQSVVDLEQLDVQIKEKLEEYEQFLKNETLANIKKFVVHVSSQFDVEGRNAGSNIISWIDRQFHTLEEKRNE